MLAARITCPHCGTQLTVTEQAPPRVTCPRCLAALDNPASPLSGAPRPVPVIPLDRQVERDNKAGSLLIYGLLALFAVGCVATFYAGNVRSGVYVALLVGGVATFLYFLGADIADAHPNAAAAPFAPPGGPFPTPAGPVVLDYGKRRPVAQRAAATAGAVAAGFFSAIGVCGLGVYILAVTADNRVGHGNAVYLGGVIVMVLLYIVATVFVSGRWRGFAPGAIAGLCLGMLALGPCAACYLMTLK